MSFLLNLPYGLSFLLVCACTVLIATLGLRFVRGRYSHEVRKENHEVAAIIFNAFGILYAVVLAFVVFVTWGRYDDASKNVEMEASKSIDIFYIAKAFPDSTCKQIRQSLYDYTSNVLNEELSAMGRGEKSQKTVDAIRSLNKIFLNMDIKTLPNVPVYEESFKQLNELAQYRRLRIFTGKDSVPEVIWVVLLTGGIIMVTYTYFFGIKKPLPQYLMTAALTITLTLILFLISILDHPFTGSSGVSTDPLRTVMEQMKNSKDVVK